MTGAASRWIILDSGGVILEAGTGPGFRLIEFIWDRMPMAENWVALDMMGVVAEVCDDVRDLLVPYVQKKDRTIPGEKIAECYRRASFGEISSLEFWHALGLGAQYPEIEKDYLDSCPRLDPEFLAVAKQLRPRYSLALLSNDVKEWASYLRSRFGVEQLFEVIVVSGEVGCRKPDRKIYEILLNRIQSPPMNCVFVDDRARNLRTAAGLGMRTIRFAREPSDHEFTPDAEIASFHELPGAVEKLLPGMS